MKQPLLIYFKNLCTLRICGAFQSDVLHKENDGLVCYNIITLMKIITHVQCDSIATNNNISVEITVCCYRFICGRSNIIQNKLLK